MAYDDRYGDDRSWRGARNEGRGARDRDDRDPGARSDYYRGGDYGQRRTGPEGGFEQRGDYRRTERYAEQGRSYGRDDRDDNNRFSDRGPGGSESSFSGSGGVNQGMGAYGGNRDSGYGIGDSAGYNTGGVEGPGLAPEFSGGPAFHRVDAGSTGTHGAHPVASPYGTAQTSVHGMTTGGSAARSQMILDQAERDQGGSGRQQYGRQHQQSQSRHDPDYSTWRQGQIDSFDRDYDDYRRENASRFEQEFGAFREKRGQQRSSMGRVTEHMDVVGSDDAHVGTVDKVKGDRIVLTKSDQSAGGHHHSIPCGWLESVDDKVRLNKTAEEAQKAWRDEETSRALFEDKDSGSDGPHILDRSFSGTYRDER